MRNQEIVSALESWGFKLNDVRRPEDDIFGEPEAYYLSRSRQGITHVATVEDDLVNGLSFQDYLLGVVTSN